MIGAIIGGALGLLGAKRQSDAAEDQSAQARAWAREDQKMGLLRLRRAAKRAGFNPLTALRASPNAGMTQPTTPALSSGAFMGQALQDAGATLFNSAMNQPDPERDALEKALMRQELATMQAQQKAATDTMRFGYAVPVANNYSGIDRVNSSPDLLGVSGMAGSHVPVGNGINGLAVEEAPISNAEDFEKRYGDAGSSVIGLGILAADAGATFQRQRERKYWERYTERMFNDMAGTHYSGGKVPRRTGSVGAGIDAAMNDDYRAFFGGQ